MTIRIRIHPALREFAAGQETAQVDGKTIAECIDSLEAQFPGIKQRLCDEQGRLYSFYDIYVNSESSYPDELAKSVKDGDELTIMAIAGGG